MTTNQGVGGSNPPQSTIISRSFGGGFFNKSLKLLAKMMKRRRYPTYYPTKKKRLFAAKSHFELLSSNGMPTIFANPPGPDLVAVGGTPPPAKQISLNCRCAESAALRARPRSFVARRYDSVSAPRFGSHMQVRMCKIMRSQFHTSQLVSRIIVSILMTAQKAGPVKQRGPLMVKPTAA